jgi:hypothetical protein
MSVAGIIHRNKVYPQITTQHHFIFSTIVYNKQCTNDIVYFQGLINEQLVNKDQLYLLSFGSQVDPIWEAIHDVNCRM